MGRGAGRYHRRGRHGLWPAGLLDGAVANAIPGIICQIVLVPLLVLALGKAGLLPDAPVRSRAASPDTAQGRA